MRLHNEDRPVNATGWYELTDAQRAALDALATTGYECVAGGHSGYGHVHALAARALERLGLATSRSTEVDRRYSITEAGTDCWIGGER